MAVNNVSDALYNQYTKAQEVKQHNNELGMDEFLQLFLTQLQHQDPSSPTDESAMLQQMVQLTTVQAMESMVTSQANSQAYAFIGKGVTGFVRNAETGETREIIGTVDSAGVKDGKAYVMVGDDSVPVENITQVFDNAVLTGDAQQMLAGTNMIGKYVAVTAQNEEGEKVTLAGQVQRVDVKEGKLYVLMGGTLYHLYQIVAVADDMETLGVPVTQEENNPEIPDEES